MTLPFTDPSLPSQPSPLFSDVTAVRGDHMRANNNCIWTNLEYLLTNLPLQNPIALTNVSLKTSILANLWNSYFTTTSATTDTPTAASYAVFVHWYSATAFSVIARLVGGLTSYHMYYSSAWGTWTQLTDATGNPATVGGAALSTDGTFAANSDTLVPSQKAVLTKIQSTILTPVSVTKTADYAILDADGYRYIFVDVTAGDKTITLPLLANNNQRQIRIMHVAGTNKVIISPNGSNANTLSSDALNVMWLAKKGDFIDFFGDTGLGIWVITAERITSQLRLNGYAGYGGTDTKIMRFTNLVESVGNMFSENHSTGYSSNAKGLEITINRSGKYALSVSYSGNSGTNLVGGFSINSSQRTTNLISCTASTILAIGSGVGALVDTIAVELFLNKGDIIRTHTDGVGPTNTATNFVTVTYKG